MASFFPNRLFGFRFGHNQSEEEKHNTPSIVPPTNTEGAFTVSVGSGQVSYSVYFDLGGALSNESDLITKYREMSLYSEVEVAIDEIVNEAIVIDQTEPPVAIRVGDQLKFSDELKAKIYKEFAAVLRLLNFSKQAFDIFKRWYIDGRLYYHVVLDSDSPIHGIKELRLIDPKTIRKIREVVQEKHKDTGIDVITNVTEYFVYTPYGLGTAPVQGAITGVKIPVDNIVFTHSGLLNETNTMILSWLHKAIKPYNQLKIMEDSLVIYRIVRAPERRVFNIDVMDLPPAKAKQYVNDIMTQYKNKMVYDSCFSMDTKVPLLDGRTLTLSEITEEFNSGKQLWAYSADPKTGEFAPGLITSAGITRKNEQVMKLTLDNGKEIICTLDHKFPIWNKGFVEAKDLIIGESMMPFYTREKQISSGKESTYQQVFENKSKKWKFTHRLVSDWKDENGLYNEYIFNEIFSTLPKLTIHHKNYNRYNNTPENLIRMNRDDHFAYHKQHCSLAGKKGGKRAAEVQRELGIGFFAMTHEEHVRLGRIGGPIGGKKSYENKLGIHGLSKEQIIENSKKGNAALQEKLKDIEFNKLFCQAQSNGWTDSSRKAAAVRGQALLKEHFEKMNILANESRWNSESSLENKKKHSKLQSIEYTPEIIEKIKNCAKSNLLLFETVDYVNENVNLETWKNTNNNKPIKNRKQFVSFTGKDVIRIVQQQGFNNWGEYRQAIVHNNHKIAKIELLEERIDVGTISVDKDEIYHGYHTFALDAGIYTKNSSGELRDDRKHMTIMEDFWFPKRSDGSGSSVDTLAGGQHLNELDDVEYFKKKLYKSLNIPVTRLEPSTGFNLGRSTEITRDEVKFAKFITRLRFKFSQLFMEALRIQLILKKITTPEDWEHIKENIYFDFISDSHYLELQKVEMMKERLDILDQASQYVGKYFSEEYIRVHVLQQTDLEMEEIQIQIKDEANKEAAGEEKPGEEPSAEGGEELAAPEETPEPGAKPEEEI